MDWQFEATGARALEPFDAESEPAVVRALRRRKPISNTVVKALARTTGRGPTKAKTTLGENGVFVVLQDSLTRGEQSLAKAGEGQAVLDLRRRWQRVMEADVSREIEELTGRKVIGFMSDNHIDPDLAVEVFVLEALPAAESSFAGSAAFDVTE
jgi:uncharacterized protein YbcI